MGGAKGILMLEQIAHNIASLFIDDDDILIADIVIEPMSYRTTVCVEYTYPSNKYWEPMLKDTKILQTDDFISQLVTSMQTILVEVACVSDNKEEIAKVCSLHSYLDEYINMWKE